MICCGWGYAAFSCARLMGTCACFVGTCARLMGTCARFMGIRRLRGLSLVLGGMRCILPQPFP